MKSIKLHKKTAIVRDDQEELLDSKVWYKYAIEQHKENLMGLERILQ